MILHTVSALLQAAAPADTTVTPDHFGVWLFASIVKLIVFFSVYMLVVAYLTLAERKICAWMQDRHGPNRVGPWGLFQPLADGAKNIMKEETYPSQAYSSLFVLAPAIAFSVAMCTWAVIPFAAPFDTPWGRIDMALAPMPIGFLFILSIASLGVYGIVLAGWASNNKYSLLGGLRSSAQMISYEIAMGMSTIPVLLLSGNVALGTIVEQQARGGWLNWNALSMSIAFFIFLVSAFAETNRLPFDLPEAESELVAGYHSEYSAMKFSMFFIAEYANMMTASALMATLFFGGWDIPFTQWDNVAPHTLLKTFVTFLVMGAKMMSFVFLFIWIRWTLPRFRYDQLMSLGWKFMLPVALGYIVVMGGAIVGLEYLGFAPGGWQFGLSLLVLNVILVGVLFLLVDRGRLISPAYAPLHEKDLEKLRAYGRMSAPLAAEGD